MLKKLSLGYKVVESVIYWVFWSSGLWRCSTEPSRRSLSLKTLPRDWPLRVSVGAPKSQHKIQLIEFKRSPKKAQPANGRKLLHLKNLYHLMTHKKSWKKKKFKYSNKKKIYIYNNREKLLQIYCCKNDCLL